MNGGKVTDENCWVVESRRKQERWGSRVSGVLFLDFSSTTNRQIYGEHGG